MLPTIILLYVILLVLLLNSQSYDDVCKDRNCELEFKRSGIFHVPNYLSQNEVNDMLNEVTFIIKNKSSYTYYSTDSHTIYQEDIDSSLPYNHLRNQLQNSSKLIIPSSKLSENSLLRSIYERSSLINMVKKVVGIDSIYRSGCPHNAAYYNIYDKGDQLGFHFDRSTFGINLNLQKANQGGEFEYHHNTRSNNDMYSYENVNNIINNSTNINIKIDGINSGSLVIFAGKYPLHRVSEVTDGTRINAILTFEKEPNVKTSPYTLKKFFGIDVHSNVMNYNNDL